MKRFFLKVGLIMSLVTFCSCQEGEKIVSIIEYGDGKCIETYHVHIDIMEGDTIKTPCGEHTIETLNGILLDKWTDNYVSTNEYHIVGTRKRYKIEPSIDGDSIHYMSEKIIYDNGGKITNECHYQLKGGKVYLDKEVEYNSDDDGEWSSIEKIYYDNKKLKSEVKYLFGMSRSTILSSSFYTSDGKKLTEIEQFNKLIGENYVYTTSVNDKKWCLIFFPEGESYGKVTLGVFTWNLKLYYERECLVYKYIINEKKQIRLFDGDKVVRLRGDNSHIDNANLDMFFTENGQLILDGIINGEVTIFESDRVPFELSQHKYNY